MPPFAVATQPIPESFVEEMLMSRIRELEAENLQLKNCTLVDRLCQIMKQGFAAYLKSTIKDEDDDDSDKEA
jgi:hypothetical protein